MATKAQIKTLSAPRVYLDGKLLKVLPNTVKIEDMREVKTRAVSSGGGSSTVVHGFDAATKLFKVTFSLAHTREYADLLGEYKGRAESIDTSVLKIVEDTDQEVIADAVLTNSVSRNYEAEGALELEFTGRSAST